MDILILMVKYKLIDNKKRSTLAEGRDYGLSTSLLLKKNDEYHTIHGITACRDFEQDCVWSFHTKKPYSIYGLKSEYIPNLFEKTKGYMVISVEKQGRALNEYANYKRDYETLSKNYKKLQKFINSFEIKFKAKGRTKIDKIEENRFICIFPRFWVDNLYKSSLFTFLLRIGLFYEKGEIFQYMRDFKFDGSDVHLINSVLPKIERFIKEGFPYQDVNAIQHPHDKGIVSYTFPLKPEKNIKFKPLKLKKIEDFWG